jgi:hypothetical protein
MLKNDESLLFDEFQVIYRRAAPEQLGVLDVLVCPEKPNLLVD